MPPPEEPLPVRPFRITLKSGQTVDYSIGQTDAFCKGLRVAARIETDRHAETDNRGCTGLTALWCPNCGDCTCRPLPGADGWNARLILDCGCEEHLNVESEESAHRQFPIGGFMACDLHSAVTVDGPDRDRKIVQVRVMEGRTLSDDRCALHGPNSKHADGD